MTIISLPALRLPVTNGVFGSLGWTALDVAGLLVVVGVCLDTAAATVTSISRPNASGTMLKLGRVVGSSRSLELWAGWGFTPGCSGSWTITPSAGGTVAAAYAIAADSALNAAPIITLSAGGSGTSTSADTGSVTPAAIGHLLVAGAGWAAATASTARVSTGNTFHVPAADTSFSASSVALAFGFARSTAASKQVWTIASNAWVALAASLELPAPAAPVANFVYKGRDTAAADAGDIA